MITDDRAVAALQPSDQDHVTRGYPCDNKKDKSGACEETARRFLLLKQNDPLLKPT